jgi:hypothetical protein
MKWRYLKSKQLLLTWLVVYLLAPLIWVHRLFMLGARPPGSLEIAEPLFIPFGGVYFGWHFFEQLFGGDFGDALIIFVFLILPIVIYTFFLSVLIYYIFLKIWTKRNSSA